MPKVIPEYKEIAKNKIINGAYIIFNSKGYHNSTMDDIARVVGVSKASLYTYFKSKEEILQTAAKESLTESFIKYFENDNYPDPLEELYKDMVKFEDTLHLNFEMIALAPYNDDVRKINIENYEKKLETLRAFVEKQQIKGTFRDDIDARTLANLFNAIFTETIIQLVIGIDKKKIRESWDNSFSTVLERKSNGDQKTLNKYFSS